MSDSFLVRFVALLGSFAACIVFVTVFPLVIRFLDFPYNEHGNPEKVSVTILDASHDYVGWLGREQFSVVVKADGEIYEISDRDTYYLYSNKIGQSFPAELSDDFLYGITLRRTVHLSGDYGVGWTVNSRLHKQQNKEVSKKCQLS